MPRTSQPHKEFYTELFDFKVDYDSDWFVHLISTGREFEIGLLQADHELVPKNSEDDPPACA